MMDLKNHTERLYSSLKAQYFNKGPLFDVKIPSDNFVFAS